MSDGTESTFFCTALVGCQAPTTLPPNGKEGQDPGAGVHLGKKEALAHFGVRLQGACSQSKRSLCASSAILLG